MSKKKRRPRGKSKYIKSKRPRAEPVKAPQIGVWLIGTEIIWPIDLPELAANPELCRPLVAIATHYQTKTSKRRSDGGIDTYWIPAVNKYERLFTVLQPPDWFRGAFMLFGQLPK